MPAGKGRVFREILARLAAIGASPAIARDQDAGDVLWGAYILHVRAADARRDEGTAGREANKRVFRTLGCDKLAIGAWRFAEPDRPAGEIAIGFLGALDLGLIAIAIEIKPVNGHELAVMGGGDPEQDRGVMALAFRAPKVCVKANRSLERSPAGDDASIFFEINLGQRAG